MNTRLLYYLLIILLISACSKSAGPRTILEGVWVEKTYRLDTLDFDKGNAFGNASEQNHTVYFGSRSFVDTTLNPIYPVVNTSFYAYRLGSDSIYLRNFLSSSTGFQPRFFKMNSGEQSFQVSKFYIRTGLFSYILEFQRIR